MLTYLGLYLQHDKVFQGGIAQSGTNKCLKDIMFAGLDRSQDNLVEWNVVVETLASRAGIQNILLTESALSRCLGSFQDLLEADKETGSSPAASWEECGVRFRKKAQKLAASGSHDCVVITRRVCLHQEAAEAFRRSGEPLSQALQLVTRKSRGLTAFWHSADLPWVYLPGQ